MVVDIVAEQDESRCRARGRRVGIPRRQRLSPGDEIDLDVEAPRQLVQPGRRPFGDDDDDVIDAGADHGAHTAIEQRKSRRARPDVGGCRGRGVEDEQAPAAQNRSLAPAVSRRDGVGETAPEEAPN